VRYPVLAASLIAIAAGCAPLSPELALHGPVPSPDDGDAFDVALFQTVGTHLVPGHGWQLEDDGRVFDGIIADVGGARVSVNIVSYIWHSGQPSDRIVAALEKRAHGVACRILVDPLGSPDFVEKVAPRLHAIGCATEVFRPLGSHPDAERNHRKIAVIDGHIGHVGGFGVRKEWVEASGSGDPEWRDINLRVQGPIVAALQRAFAQNWQEAGGTLLPAVDFPRIEPDGAARVGFVSSTFGFVTNADRLTLVTIASAQKRLWLWNAYFVPDQRLSDLLVDRARHGVDVRILMPGDKNDVEAAKLGQRRAYAPLVAAGVRLYEYQPTMMHAKTMIVDDRLAVIGSINLDSLSLTRLEEDAVIVDDPALVAALARDWEADVAKSRRVPDAVRH
jgi:cardiolipin synthase